MSYSSNRIRECVGMSFREDWDATVSVLKLSRKKLSGIKIIRGDEYNPNTATIAIYRKMGYRV